MVTRIDEERRLAVPPEVIATFRGALGAVTPDMVYGLPDLTAYINHEGGETRPELHFPRGLFINPAMLRESDDRQPTALPSQMTFVVSPEVRMGREDSRHKLFFGNLATFGLGKQALSAETQVAVKPMVDATLLLGELAMFQYMRALKLPTYEPFGMLLTTRVDDYGLTILQQQIDTLDNVVWQELDIDERWLQLGIAIDTAALLNSNMLFHGDLEFRNVGFGDIGDLCVVDPELTVSAIALAETYKITQDEVVQARIVLKISQLMSKDFTDLTNNIRGSFFKGLPEGEYPKTETALFKALKRHLFMPYKEALLEINSEHITLLMKAYDCMLHSKKELSRQ